MRISKEASVFDRTVKTIVITDATSLKHIERSLKLEHFNQLEESRQLIFETINFTKNIAGQICAVLQKHQIESLLVEGGTQTLQTFVDANLWDEANVFVSKTSFKNGIKAPILSASMTSEIRIKNDVLKKYIND